MDLLGLLVVQGTLKSLLQHHSSKASILWCSAFFIVQLSHPYMTTGKTIALTRWTFVPVMYYFSVCVCVCVCVLPSHVWLWDYVDYSPPGSSVHRILQPRILEWVSHSLLQGIFPIRDQIQVSCIAVRFVTIWAIREAPLYINTFKNYKVTYRWHET